MRIPEINPVGVLTRPDAYAQTPRTYPALVRAFAAVLVTMFLSVVVVTSAASLGAYCLTSGGSNLRALPTSYLEPSGPAPADVP
jgi:hypothetical protein